MEDIIPISGDLTRCFCCGPSHPFQPKNLLYRPQLQPPSQAIKLIVRWGSGIKLSLSKIVTHLTRPPSPGSPQAIELVKASKNPPSQGTARDSAQQTQKKSPYSHISTQGEIFTAIKVKHIKKYLAFFKMLFLNIYLHTGCFSYNLLTAALLWGYRGIPHTYPQSYPQIVWTITILLFSSFWILK